MPSLECLTKYFNKTELQTLKQLCQTTRWRSTICWVPQSTIPNKHRVCFFFTVQFLSAYRRRGWVAVNRSDQNKATAAMCSLSRDVAAYRTVPGFHLYLIVWSFSYVHFGSSFEKSIFMQPKVPFAHGWKPKCKVLKMSSSGCGALARSEPSNF